MVTPVFICTGFLDSGKTTLVKDTLMLQDWIEPGHTLLIVCEEGEESYSKEYLKEHDMVMVAVEEPGALNNAFLKECKKKYQPIQVVIEYNGMWNLEDALKIHYPIGWQIQGIYSTVNGQMLDMYLKNMRNMLMEQLTESELIVVNRCSEEVNRSGFRRAVKVQNPMGQLLFEGMDGKIIQPSQEDLPYDMKQDKIEIGDTDFGIWYVDAYEHPDCYIGKEVEFLAQVFRPRGMKEQMFVPGRQIMTCCADDIRFYGYPCKAEEKITFAPREWMRVRAEFRYEPAESFGREQPVLYLIAMEPARKPKEETVYLG